MRTGEVARMLGLSRGRVRALTTHALPRRLPCEWLKAVGMADEERVFDSVEVRLWDIERKDWWKNDAGRRARLEKKYGGRLGMTAEILDRWAARGWK